MARRSRTGTCRPSFDEIAGKGLARRDELYPLIASLIRAERIHRQARSISYRISGAKFPVLKDLDSFVFADTPVDQGQVRELATGTFLDAKRNSIFIGGTGTGKTHLCIAIAAAVIRSRARGRFFNLVDLVNQLERPGRETASPRSHRYRRTRLSPIQPIRRAVAVPPDQQALREHITADHHQPRLRRLAAGVRRRQDDHRHARPPDAPLRHHRDRQHQLAIQKPKLNKPSPAPSHGLLLVGAQEPPTPSAPRNAKGAALRARGPSYALRG